MQPLDVNADESFRSFIPGQQQEDDRSLIVEFFVGKKLLGAQSLAAGREIYEDREYIRILIKGQDKQVVVKEVTPEIKARFPIAYEMFRLRKPAPVVGTPIEQLPGIGPSMAHHLKGLNLRSVEDMANVTDDNTLSRIGMGARELVNRAKAWLEQANEKTVKLEQENVDLRRMLGEMNERMKALEKPKRKYTRKKEGGNVAS